jgi:hypothetical protein
MSGRDRMGKYDRWQRWVRRQKQPDQWA